MIGLVLSKPFLGTNTLLCTNWRLNGFESDSSFAEFLDTEYVDNYFWPIVGIDWNDLII